MNRSLRRTLAVRFAATMGVGLLAVAAAVLYGGHLFFEHHLDPTLIRATVVPVVFDKRAAICCISVCSRIAVMDSRVGRRNSRRMHSAKAG